MLTSSIPSKASGDLSAFSRLGRDKAHAICLSGDKSGEYLCTCALCHTMHVINLGLDVPVPFAIVKYRIQKYSGVKRTCSWSKLHRSAAQLQNLRVQE